LLKASKNTKLTFFAWRVDLYTAEKSCVELLPGHDKNTPLPTYTHKASSQTLACKWPTVCPKLKICNQPSRGCNVPRQTDVYSVWLFLASIKANIKDKHNDI